MPDSIKTLLAQSSQKLAAVSDSALLDAEVLLCHCLHKSRSFLRAWPEKSLSDEQNEQFNSLLTQRLKGVPIAYLTGNREFWSRKFIVNEAVLIPRPDSELLIELCLPRLNPNQAAKIIDLGSGSGVLAITLAAERPLAKVIACDISCKALEITQLNAKNLNIRNLHCIHSNWFESINEHNFDLVVSNPPYIAADDPHLKQGDVRFEPGSALVSGENGLQDIRLIAAQARERLTNGGWLLIEHGYNQQQDVQAIFSGLNYQDVNTHTDLSNNPRVTSGLWKHS